MVLRSHFGAVAVVVRLGLLCLLLLWVRLLGSGVLLLGLLGRVFGLGAGFAGGGGKPLIGSELGEVGVVSGLEPGDGVSYGKGRIRLVMRTSCSTRACLRSVRRHCEQTFIALVASKVALL